MGKKMEFEPPISVDVGPNFFKDNLRFLLDTSGITLERMGEIIAKHLGRKEPLSRSIVSEWQTGKRYPDMPISFVLCKFFKYSLSELYETDIRKNPRKINADNSTNGVSNSREGLIGGRSSPTANGETTESPPNDLTLKVLEIMLQVEKQKRLTQN